MANAKAKPRFIMLQHPKLPGKPVRRFPSATEQLWRSKGWTDPAKEGA